MSTTLTPIPVEYKRIVVLGDSLTDGHTYPALVRQALLDAGYEAPLFINAGIAGDTAAGMLARLERDVLAYRPTLVTLLAGTNDVNLGFTFEDYRANVTAIAERLHQEGIPLLVFTTCIIEPDANGRDEKLEEFSAFLRQFAAERGCRLADLRKGLCTARDAGVHLMETDTIHPNFTGQSIFARTLLDALGFTEVPLPAKLVLEEMPGLVKDWQMRAVREDEAPLNAQTMQAIVPDENWIRYTLPEPKPFTDSWWFEHERQRGFALRIEQYVGSARSYLGYATIDCEQPQAMYLNIGANLTSAWLNGEQVYKSDGTWRGWHPGKERVAVQFKAGENVLIIETGNQFFLSLTETNDW